LCYSHFLKECARQCKPNNKRGRLNPSGYGVEGRFLVAYWRVSGIGKVRKELGANIRTFRKKAGLSQERLAEKAELHPVYISQVECGTNPFN
jgi:hypothetical protein